MKKRIIPNVFEYSDYRIFLRDAFAALKQGHKKYSYRQYSTEAGLKSPSILKEVVDGKKGISYGSIAKFAKPFGLGAKERKYFEQLVLFNQATDEDERSRYFREMIKLQRSPQSTRVSPDQYTLYNDWFNVVVREIVALEDFRPDPEWIAAKVSPNITANQAAGALTFLRAIGLLKQREDGSWVQAAAKLEVDPDAMIIAYRDFSRRMIELGWEAVDRFDTADRELSSLTLHMSEDCYTDVIRLIRQYKQEILDYVAGHPGANELVCQLNYQLFPLVSDWEKGKRRKQEEEE